MRYRTLGRERAVAGPGARPRRRGVPGRPDRRVHGTQRNPAAVDRARCRTIRSRRCTATAGRAATTA